MHAIDGAREAIAQAGVTGYELRDPGQVARVNAMLDRLTELNKSVEGTLDQVSGISGEVNTLVGDAVRSLQFEDIVRQLGNMSATLCMKLISIHGGLSDLRQSETRTPQDFVRAPAEYAGRVDGIHRHGVDVGQQARGPGIHGRG